MTTLGENLIKALEEFSKQLENGEPIVATEVQRVETPDGPMHLRRKVILNKDSNDEVRD